MNGLTEHEQTFVMIFRFLSDISSLVFLVSSSAIVITFFKLRKIYRERKSANQQQIEDIKSTIETDLTLMREANKVILKMKIIDVCQASLNEGHVTSHHLARITDMYEVYTKLGGNGQAKLYYEKVKELPVKQLGYDAHIN